MKKLFTLALAMLASVGLWAVETTNVGTYSTQVVSTDGLTSTWTFPLPSSQINVPTGETEENGIIYAPSASGKMKFTSSNQFSWQGQSSAYIYVPAGGAGTITMTVKGSSDSRWLQLYVNGTAAADSKRLWSKYNETPTSDGKKGPQSFAFTADDLTTKGGKTYLHFKDNDTELKVATFSITLTAGSYAGCDNPEASIIEDKAGFAGDAVDLEFSSLNTNDVAFDVKKGGVAAVENTDYAWVEGDFKPLVAGTFVITATQTADGTYCAVEESVNLTINEKTPVTAVTIDGPAAGFIGQELTYTATAAGATAYEWYLDDVKQGSDSAKFIYTAVKGNHSIVCKARNQFNDAEEWIASEAKAVTITKACGELIAFTAETGSGNIDKDITATGVVGGTAHQKTDKNGKIGSNGYYVSLTLANGSFMAGDTVRVVSSTTYAKLHLFSDQGTNSIAEKATPANNDYVILDKGATTIYLYRNSTDGSNMNPTVVSMSVTRSCEESDNNNATVTINGEAAEKSGTVFNYTLSASYEEATVAVEIALEHPLATLMEDHAASFTMATPEVGTPTVETFKVKAENGEQAWYSIFVNKSAELSHDATLKSLSVTGYTLSPEFAPSVKSYYITKAYGADDPATDKVVYETNHANATAVVQAFEDALVVTVTAEDGTTHISYTINIETADAPKSLSKVLFSNGFDAFIDNTNHTVKAFYLSGTEAPTATTITAGAGTAGELADGKIIVTGADSKTCEYIVTLEAVTPNTDVVEESAEAGVFAGTEAWVKGGLHISDPTNGFTGGKYVLRRQLKSGDAADDQRVIAGWVRAYFFVGNASKLELANTANKKVKYAVDGGAYTETEANPIEIALEEGNHMIEIVTNQSSGDCNLSAPKLVKRVPTALDNAADGVKAQKFIENGQLYIQKDGKIYNVMGMEIR